MRFRFNIFSFFFVCSRSWILMNNQLTRNKRFENVLSKLGHFKNSISRLSTMELDFEYSCSLSTLSEPRKSLVSANYDSWTIRFCSYQHLFMGHIPGLWFECSSDPSHFISDINVGKSRIRHWTTLELNDEFPDRLKIQTSNSESFFVGWSDPDRNVSNIDFENKMDWVLTTLKSDSWYKALLPLLSPARLKVRQCNFFSIFYEGGFSKFLSWWVSNLWLVAWSISDVCDVRL